MHSYCLSIALNYSIVIAAVLAIIRFKFIIRSFYPFLFLIWLGFINESVSLFMIFSSGNNALNSNIFVLAEFLLILSQFSVWNFHPKRKYIALAVLGMVIWAADNFILNTITQNNSLFRAFYSFVIVIFSINQINKIMVYERGSLLKNAMFIICITFLFYYGCKTFVEIFNAFHLGLSRTILWNFWIIMYFVNAISNILFAIAVLCIPTRQEFTLPY